MRLSLIAMLTVVPFLAIGCGQRDRDEVGTRAEEAADAGEIAKRPDAFYGRPVTVVAEVEKVHGSNAFTLDADDATGGPDVLVIVPKAERPVEEDHEVMVHGTVRPLVVSELKRDYGWFNPSAYEPELLARFKEGPVIIADSVRDQERGDVIAGVRRPLPVKPPAENEPPSVD